MWRMSGRGGRFGLAPVGLLVVAIVLLGVFGRPMVARAEGVFIPAELRQDAVFDETRGLLYITDGDKVLRYDVEGEQLLQPFTLGGYLGTIDISPDRRHLLVTENGRPNQPYLWVWQVDLDSGYAWQMSLPSLDSHGVWNYIWEMGAFSGVYGADGTFAFTARDNGGEAPVRRYIQSSDETTVYASPIWKTKLLARSPEYDMIGFVGFDAAGPVGNVRFEQGDVVERAQVHETPYELAIASHGSRYAVVAQSGAYVLDQGMGRLGLLGEGANVPIGAAFDPTGRILYLPWSGGSSVRAYRTDTLTQIDSFDVEDTFDYTGFTMQEGRLKVSEDGRYLAVTVQGGVRLVDLTNVGLPRVTGNVRSSGGLPVPDARVEFYTPDGEGGWRLETSCTAGPLGEWGARVETETTRIRVVDPAGAHESACYGGPDLASADDVLPLEATDSPLDVTLRLTAPASITTTITSETGAPVVGATVTLYERRIPDVSLLTTVTGQSGVVHLGSLPAGSYALRVAYDRDWFGDEYYADSRTFDAAKTIALTAGAHAECPVSLTSLLFIRGHAYDARSGRAVAGVSVRAFDAASAWGNGYDVVAETVTRGDGSYTLGGLPPSLCVIAFCDLTDTYRDVTWPSRGLPLSASYALDPRTWTASVDGHLMDLRTLATDRIFRSSGADRYATAIQVSRDGFSQATNAILTSGEAFPDALSAAPLAGMLDAPLFLTSHTSLPAGLVPELRRLGVRNVYIVGGTARVPDALVKSLTAAGFACVRDAGATRYETCGKVVRRMRDIATARKHDLPEPFVCSGDAFPDALAAAPFAYRDSRPILLTKFGAMPEPTFRHWRELSGVWRGNVLIVGGTGAVSDTVLAQLYHSSQAGQLLYYRAKGKDRYETCGNLVVAMAGGNTYPYDFVGVASGAAFPDALAGGAACGRFGAPLLLTPPTTLHPTPKSVLARYGFYVTALQAFGGTGAVSSSTLKAVGDALGLYVYDIDRGFQDLPGAPPLGPASVRPLSSAPAAPGVRPGRTVLPHDGEQRMRELPKTRWMPSGD